MRNYFPLFLAMLPTLVCGEDAWKPAPSKLMTTWGEKVDPATVLPEYPRPQMVRKNWAHLNGLWDYAITPKDAPQPEKWDGKILVPFCAESALSGVGKTVGQDNRLWYRLVTDKIKPTAGQAWLLHFGAVDWHAQVMVNGKPVGEHKGGYDPFSFDVSAALKSDGPQEIIVSVWDPTDASWIPRGKQVARPRGIWYTPVTGIWQTVWAEPVSASNHIESLSIQTDFDQRKLLIKAQVSHPAVEGGLDIIVTSQKGTDGGKIVEKRGARWNEVTEIALPESVEPWSPEKPQLYQVTCKLSRSGNSPVIDDEVGGYFGLRKISLGKDGSGITRIFLNNKPYFQYGPLDQGWWPDGLYTAPSDEALKYDLEMTKKWGMNMVRKHVKVEPARWYYWCDTLGLLVWQDMPSGDKYILPKDPDIQRSPESAANFENEWSEIIRDFSNFPSIVMWVPYNEGWGQWDTPRIAEFTRKLDPTRLVNAASGWTDRPGAGDVHDKHAYPGPDMFAPEEKRATVLGEFGGLGLPVEGHTWLQKGNWGYRSFDNKEALGKAYLDLLAKLRPLVGKGLSAAVYTQTTDVEIEVNGLMTYDRRVIKAPEGAAAAAAKLYLPPPIVRELVPASDKAPQDWDYSLEKPADGWEKPGFDTGKWSRGQGGFGAPGTPGAVVKTEWKTSGIWLRREFTLTDEKAADPHLFIQHDDECEVYINGVLAAKLDGYSTSYDYHPISKAAREALKKGANTLAVFCTQHEGGQYIDVGIVDFLPPK